MSMTVVLIAMVPTLVAELRASADAGILFFELTNGSIIRDGFDHRADMWTDADWRDFDAYTGSDENHPLMRLFQGPVLDDRIGYLQGPPSWLDPAPTKELFADLGRAEGFDPATVDAEQFLLFEGLVPFLKRAVETGKGLATGVD